MPLDDYLARNGIDPDRDVDDLSRQQAVERAVETAYYRARLSDSTYHGTNHNAKVNAVSTVVKTWPQFDRDDFRKLDRAVDQVIDERTA